MAKIFVYLLVANNPIFHIKPAITVITQFTEKSNVMHVWYIPLRAVWRLARDTSAKNSAIGYFFSELYHTNIDSYILIRHREIYSDSNFIVETFRL